MGLHILLSFLVLPAVILGSLRSRLFIRRIPRFITQHTTDNVDFYSRYIAP